MKPLIGLMLLGALSVPASAAELMTLVDSNGVAVGPVASYENDAVRVAIKVGTRTFLVQFLPTRVDDLDTVYYQTSDCTGTPLLRIYPATNEFTEQYAIDKPGLTMYVRDYKKAISTRTAGSVGGISSCGVINLTTKFAIAYPVVDFSTAYAPPFRIRASASATQYPAQ